MAFGQKRFRGWRFGGVVRGLLLALAMGLGSVAAVAQAPVEEPRGGAQPSQGDGANPMETRGGSLAAPAQPPHMPDVVPPADPVAAKAFAVLDKHCARCHQGGRLKRASPAGGLGNILRLDALAENAAAVVPGNPDASRLVTLMQRRLMPFDVFQERAKGEEPTGEEVQAVRAWIAKLAPVPQCPGRTPVSAEEIAAAIAASVGEAGAAAERYRFVSIAHLYNACHRPEQMFAWRQAIITLFNSLSWKPEPVRVAPVDAAETVYRVDLADLGWVVAHWDRIMQGGPSPAGRLSQLASTVRKTLATETPIARADWLAHHMLEAPLYYDLLGLPEAGPEILRILLIDPDPQRRAGTGSAMRLGLRPSQFSRTGRLIERWPSAGRAHWSTYDAIAREGHRDPADTPASLAVPAHDAVLGHFQLPNGFPAFYALSQRGLRVDQVPAELSRRSVGLPKGARPARDCLGCHSVGPALSSGEPAATAPLASAANGDRTVVAAALRRAGVVPEFTLDGMAPLAALARQYARPLSAAQLAAEMMLPLASLEAAAAVQPGGAAARRALLGSVPRADLDNGFAALMAAAGLAPPPAPAESGPAGTAGVAGKPVDAAEAAPVLEITADKAHYTSGDALTLTIRTSTDCHLTVVSIDQRGRATVLYPSDFEANNLLGAGRPLRLPAEGAPYVLRLRERGREVIAAQCNPGGATVDGIRHEFERQRFTDLGDYGTFLAQAFDSERQQVRRTAAPPATEQRGRGRRQARERAEGTDTQARPEAIARTAITIEVR